MDQLHNLAMSSDIENITVHSGSIIFSGYEALKKDAQLLADHIAAIEVTDENIKQSKKLLAAVNNKIKELESKRISIKKVMLEPYNTFEQQVKEIVCIVKAADEEVRQQVRHLEEQERQEKEKQIEEIFLKRKKHYSALDGIIDFFSFLKPKHLNKTTTLESVEKEMVDFFEKSTLDIKWISNMDNGSAILRHYMDVFDLTLALTRADEEKKREEALNASKVMQEKKSPGRFTFTVYDQKDMALLMMFMAQNSITYEMKEGM